MQKYLFDNIELKFLALKRVNQAVAGMQYGSRIARKMSGQFLDEMLNITITNSLWIMPTRT